MALTANREVDRYVDQELRTLPVKGSTKIYKGGLVGLSGGRGEQQGEREHLRQVLHEDSLLGNRCLGRGQPARYRGQLTSSSSVTTWAFPVVASTTPCTCPVSVRTSSR